MSSPEIDPFFEDVGEVLGVPPEKIRLRQAKIPGEFTLAGPGPQAIKPLIDLPQIRNYCFTFVLKTPPPRAICDAYQQEYDQLREQLPGLIEAEAWDDLAAVGQRLSELETAIRNTCRIRERAITYCIFPDDWFEDPFRGEPTVPGRPPIPPL